MNLSSRNITLMGIIYRNAGGKDGTAQNVTAISHRS